MGLCLSSCTSPEIEYAGVSIAKICDFDPVESQYNIIKNHLDREGFTTYILDRSQTHLYTYDGTDLLFVLNLPDEIEFWDFGVGCDFSLVNCKLGTVERQFTFEKYTVLDVDFADQCNLPNGNQGDEVVDEQTGTYYFFNNGAWEINRQVSFTLLYLWGEQYPPSIFECSRLYRKTACGNPIEELPTDFRLFDLGNFNCYFFCEESNRWQRDNKSQI